MADTSYVTEQDCSKNREMLAFPERILIFSGKRKSGKDFITDELFKRLGDERCVIVKVSGPIKSHWAKHKGLDVGQLLSSGEYKEQYRLEMVKWGENMRNQDYGCFCRAAIDMYNANTKPVWIISDARRKTDLKWFKENYGNKCKTIRISCSEEIRQNRGWIFTKGIDDSQTECDLDDIDTWDLEVNNNGENIDTILQKIGNLLN